MLEFHPNFVVDEKSNKQSVILPYIEWQQILAMLEAFDKSLDIPQWQKEELDKRLLEHKTKTEEHTPYKEFHAELRNSL
ncbi:MAG: hypothetical protein GQ569_11425 [Methylococcaceae bacterium]|nr:hypothetical protein [Methylococcaceae bacterium]